jgi:hypothetical protein
MKAESSLETCKSFEGLYTAVNELSETSTVSVEEVKF